VEQNSISRSSAVAEMPGRPAAALDAIRSRRASLTAAIFLMATSAIGPGFITQTATFTTKLGAAFAFGIDGLAIVLEPFAASATEQDVRALAGERHCDAMAQPLRRGEHQRAFFANTKIHLDYPSCYSDCLIGIYRGPSGDYGRCASQLTANTIRILTLT